MVDAYVDGEGCRWATITGYLGGAEISDCGHCDICRGNRRPRRAARPVRRVLHDDFGPGEVITEAHDTITVLFERAGYRTLSKELLADPSSAAGLRFR